MIVEIVQNNKLYLYAKKVFAHEGFKKYFANTSWLFAEKILRMTVGLFVSVWVARYLGPSKYGLLSYARSFVGLFTAIATLGLDGIIVRELVKDENKRDLLLGTAFVLKLIGAIFVLIFLAIAVNFTSNDKFTNLLIFIIASATIFQSFNVIDFYFQSKVLSKYVVFSNMISLFLSSLLKIYFILTNKPLLYFAIIVIFDNFILALGFIYFYTKQKLSLLKWKFNKKVAINLLHDSWPLIFSGVVISIYMRIDQVMIKWMLDSNSVGQYAAAVRISEMWYFIPIVITRSLFPAIVNAKKKSEKLYYARLQKLYDLMVWLAISVGCVVTLFGKWIIFTLYGFQYINATNVLIIHIWRGFAVTFGIVWSKWILIENKQKKIIIFHIVGMILNILFNLYFIPLYKISGAAIATVLSSFIAQILGLVYYKKQVAFQFLLKALFPLHLFNKNI